MTRIIPLTRGKVAIVDDDDFERINAYKWFYHSQGYAACMFGRKMVLMHRVIMNTPQGMETDHANRDRLDNRRENLRICTQSQNQSNRAIGTNNTSGYKGVSWRPEKSKWLAHITVNGQRKHLGYFDTPEQAADAYDEASRKYHMEFSRANRQ